MHATLATLLVLWIYALALTGPATPGAWGWVLGLFAVAVVLSIREEA